MTVNENQAIVDAYHDFLDNKDFSCVAAKAALTKQQIHCFVAEHIGCPKDDAAILSFLYAFVDLYRQSHSNYNTAAVIFKGPCFPNEESFDSCFWQRLQALTNLDAKNFIHDKRVASDPASPNYSFSLKEEAFFIIGLHSSSNRPTRRFSYPTIVFNPHNQFEELRANNQYEKMKSIVRKRDFAYAGSVNPMLRDFGDLSEVFQYSGRQYDREWKCPLNVNHASDKHDTPA